MWKPDARSAAYSSSTDLPTPASPRTTSTALSPDRARCSCWSSTSHSLRRPRNTDELTRAVSRTGAAVRSSAMTPVRKDPSCGPRSSSSTAPSPSRRAGTRHRPAPERRPPRHRRRQPAARARLRRRGRQRRRPLPRGPGRARRALLRRRRDLQRRCRRRRDHRPRLRRRLRAGPRRELLHAGRAVPRQHARRRAGTGPARRRHDRPLHRRERFHEQFAADVPAGERRAWRRRSGPSRRRRSPSRRARPLWKELPSWFLFGEEDRNIPAAVEHYMAKRAQRAPHDRDPGRLARRHGRASRGDRPPDPARRRGARRGRATHHHRRGADRVGGEDARAPHSAGCSAGAGVRDARPPARGVRAGGSQVLVLRGEAGVGKTALLEHLIAQAPDCRVPRAAGVESEMELPFAGLHQLCAPLLDRLDRCRRPQRDALCTAFGLSAGPAPDRFLVGVAVLGLLSDAAEERPLVCVVDDAQWLDRASVRRWPSSRAACGGAGRARVRRPRAQRGARAGRAAGAGRGRARRRRRARHCWTPRFPACWTTASATGSWPRRAATRSRCWSCRAGSRPRSWRAASGCRR